MKMTTKQGVVLEKRMDTYVQAYYVQRPSAELRKLLPMKYTFISSDGTKINRVDDDSLPIFALLTSPGYLFMRSTRSIDLIDYSVEIPATSMKSLATYFHRTNEDESADIDTIIEVSPGRNAPIAFTQPCVFKLRLENFMANDLKSTILRHIRDEIKASKINSVESFVRNIIDNCPVLDSGIPYKYPNIIDNDTFKNPKISWKDLVISYDVRTKTPQEEVEFIKFIENTFETKSKETITITNTYNNILPGLIALLDSSKIKYEKSSFTIDDVVIDSIVLNAASLDKIKFPYQLTDFL